MGLPYVREQRKVHKNTVQWFLEERHLANVVSIGTWTSIEYISV